MRYAQHLCLILGLVFLTSFQTSAKEYAWKYLYTIDGDTVLFEALFLPDPLQKMIAIRINHVDTPESGWRAQCEEERKAARQVKEFVKEQIDKAKKVRVTIKDFDKYGARLLGDVILDDKPLSQTLLERGYAKQYEGKTKESWCTKVSKGENVQ